MYLPRELIRFFTEYTRSEKIGIAILLLLWILYFLLKNEVIIQQSRSPIHIKYLSYQAADSILEKRKKGRKSNRNYSKDVPQKLQISKRFNPNRVSAREFRKMGFSYHFVSKLLSYKRRHNYIEQTETFLSFDDFNSSQKALISKFITFEWFDSDKEDDNSTHSSNKKNIADGLSKAEQTIISHIQDLNSAEADQLIAISGIGPVLSKRIIRYRDLLGGFVDPDQLYEVWGLDSSVAKRLIKSASIARGPKQLSLNSCSIKDLKNHPYCSYSEAKMIVNYRNQHGKFKSTKELNQIYGLDHEWIRKILPYLNVDLAVE